MAGFVLKLLFRNLGSSAVHVLCCLEGFGGEGCLGGIRACAEQQGSGGQGAEQDATGSHGSSVSFVMGVEADGWLSSQHG